MWGRSKVAGYQIMGFWRVTETRDSGLTGKYPEKI